ncbi:MAG: efflux RND transporter periplasmic adaptor subunit, partial [Terriglobia bacterium]
LRAGFERLGLLLLLPPELRSNSITTLSLPPGLGYRELHDRVRADGFVIYEGQGQLSSEMFRVAQLSTIRTLVNVPQSNVAGIRVGMPATVTVNELPGRNFTGKVARTASSLDPNTRTMLVEVQVPNGDGKLLPGMYAEIHFRTHRDAPPLLVPGDTLISTNNGQQVAVLREAENGARRIHMQPIQTGRDYGTETEVTAGLQGDELLVVNPGDDVREGALVMAEAAKQEPAPKK